MRYTGNKTALPYFRRKPLVKIKTEGERESRNLPQTDKSLRTLLPDRCKQPVFLQGGETRNDGVIQRKGGRGSVEKRGLGQSAAGGGKNAHSNDVFSKKRALTPEKRTRRGTHMAGLKKGAGVNAKGEKSPYEGKKGRGKRLRARPDRRRKGTRRGKDASTAHRPPETSPPPALPESLGNFDRRKTEETLCQTERFLSLSSPL